LMEMMEKRYMDYGVPCRADGTDLGFRFSFTQLVLCFAGAQSEKAGILADFLAVPYLAARVQLYTALCCCDQIQIDAIGAGVRVERELEKRKRAPLEGC